VSTIAGRAARGPIAYHDRAIRKAKGMDMHGRARMVTGMVAMLVAGCGGGGGLGSGGTRTPGSGTAYPFVAPPAGVTRTYAEVVVDNSASTINIGYSDTTTSIDANGSYVADVRSTTGASSIVSYLQKGSVVDVESVTVPAGTFTALKLQSTWTTASGTVRDETVINWRDTKTLYSLKQEITIAVSGTPPANGYAVSRTIELQTIS
jgi:hypothetical protein